MLITEEFRERSDEIFTIAYGAYCAEVSSHAFLEPMRADVFRLFLREKTRGMRGVIALERGRCVGYALCSGDGARREIPAWGMGAVGENRVGIIARLFQALAALVICGGKTVFCARIYAGDADLQRLFCMTQFGYIAERTVRGIAAVDAPRADIFRLSGAGLDARWGEVWALTDGIVGHLRESPVFYPGKEFTEDVYREFFTDPETTVLVAADGGRLVGIIEANPERYPLAFPSREAFNVGEIYVMPGYRGSGLAAALLGALEDTLVERGILFDWVEHGTANPNARGFWNRYFETFEYELVREIEV